MLKVLVLLFGPVVALADINRILAAYVQVNNSHFFYTTTTFPHNRQQKHQNTCTQTMVVYPIAMASLLFLSVMKLLATAFTTGSRTLKETEQQEKAISAGYADKIFDTHNEESQRGGLK